MRIRHTAFPWVRSAVDSEIRQVITNHGKMRRFNKGECVVKAGEFYPNIAIVVSGMLSKSFEVKESSKNEAMSIILPGSMLGDSFFMSRRASNLSARALRETAVMEVCHDVIERKMCSNQLFFSRSLKIGSI